MLTNYAVSIPPGGRSDHHYVGARGQDLQDRGLDADQMEAAIKATIKILPSLSDKA